MTFPAWLPFLLGLLTAVGPLATDMYLPAFDAIEADFGTPPGTAQLAALMKRRRIQRLDDLDHEPDQMIFRQPVNHVGRQQKMLITDHRTIPTSHTQVSREWHPQSRTTGRDSATTTI